MERFRSAAITWLSLCVKLCPLFGLNIENAKNDDFSRRRKKDNWKTDSFWVNKLVASSIKREKHKWEMEFMRLGKPFKNKISFLPPTNVVFENYLLNVSNFFTRWYNADGSIYHHKSMFTVFRGCPLGIFRWYFEIRWSTEDSNGHDLSFMVRDPIGDYN